MSPKTIFALALCVVAWANFLPGGAHADSGQRETFESLATPPKSGIEVAQGRFFSALLNKEVPYRVFSPENPTWKKEEPQFSKRKNIYLPQGMPIAIYVLNIETPAPRPSSASDREIIDDLILPRSSSSRP